MAKKNKKKNKKRGKDWAGQVCPVTGQSFRNGQPQGGGLFAGLGRMLPQGRTEQFLLGAAVGAVAAYVLSDEEMRTKLIKSGVKLYSGLVGGFEEIKEQVADLKAEFEAEQGGLG
jgi:hypothetical protein